MFVDCKIIATGFNSLFWHLSITIGWAIILILGLPQLLNSLLFADMNCPLPNRLLQTKKPCYRNSKGFMSKL